MIVEAYLREDGSSPFQRWFEGLDTQAATKVLTATLWMEAGNTSAIKWLGGGLGEYRIDWGPGYRIYLTQEGQRLIVLFAGGTKRRQQADIAQAQGLLAEYQSRKKRKG